MWCASQTVHYRDCRDRKLLLDEWIQSSFEFCKFVRGQVSPSSRKLGAWHIQRDGYYVLEEPFLSCEAYLAIKNIYIQLERTENEIQEGNRAGSRLLPGFLTASFKFVFALTGHYIPGLVNSFLGLGGW